MDKQKKAQQTQPVASEVDKALPVASHSRKKLIIFGLVGAVVLLAISGGVFVYSLQNKPKTPVLAQISPTSQPTPTPESEIPSDWRTFESDDFAFTFSYPGDFELTEDESVRVNFIGPTQREGTEVYDGVILVFDPVKPLGDQLLQPYVKEDLGKQREHAEVIKDLAETEVKGVKGYTYSISGLGEFTFIYLPTPDGKGVVRINYLVADPENSGYQKKVDQILSSFEFTK